MASFFPPFANVELSIKLDGHDAEIPAAGMIMGRNPDNTYRVLTMRHFGDGDREDNVPADDLRYPQEDMGSRSSIYRDATTRMRSIHFMEHTIQKDFYAMKNYINLRDDMQGGALRWLPLNRVLADNATSLADIIEDFADETVQEHDADPDYQPAQAPAPKPVPAPAPKPAPAPAAAATAATACESAPNESGNEKRKRPLGFDRECQYCKFVWPASTSLSCFQTYQSRCKTGKKECAQVNVKKGRK